MRTESRGLWLLAALAGWALLAALAASLGLGGRIAPLPDDPGLVPPLAQPRAAPEPDGGLVDTGQIGARPLFSPDRRPDLDEPLVADTAPPMDLRLTGVILSGDMRMAILTDGQDRARSWRVRVDQPLAGAPEWRLVDLAPRHAVLSGPEGRSELALEVFDGHGGEPPTALGAAAQRPVLQAQGMRRQDPAPQEAGAEEDADAEAQAAVFETVDAADAEAQSAGGGDADLDREAQVERIRQRIQERREQLRRQQGADGAPPPSAQRE